MSATPDAGEFALEAVRQLVMRTREPTRRVLVEFYESDWAKISQLKDALDLSWKDLFHALALWLAAFESDPQASKMVADLVGRLDVKL